MDQYSQRAIAPMKPGNAGEYGVPAPMRRGNYHKRRLRLWERTKPKYEFIKPIGISSNEFWAFFDWLPKAEKDLINNATDGDHAKHLYARAIELYWDSYEAVK